MCERGAAITAGVLTLFIVRFTLLPLYPWLDPTVSGLIAATIATGMIPTALLILFFALMGFGSGLAGPSRDLLVRAAAPKNATGRVYGVVYSGLDAGLAIAPPIFGAAMDGGHPLWLFSMMSVFFIAALVAAMNVGAKTDSAARQLAQTSKPAH